MLDSVTTWFYSSHLCLKAANCAKFIREWWIWGCVSLLEVMYYVALVNFVLYLGVLSDPLLSWTLHVHAITSRAIETCFYCLI